MGRADEGAGTQAVVERLKAAASKDASASMQFTEEEIAAKTHDVVVQKATPPFVSQWSPTCVLEKALSCLTSLIGREAVEPGWYERC